MEYILMLYAWRSKEEKYGRMIGAGESFWEEV